MTRKPPADASEWNGSRALWCAVDTWAGRIITIGILLTMLSGSIMAYANINNRVADLDKRVSAIEKCLDEKISPMREDVAVIKAGIARLEEQHRND